MNIGLGLEVLLLWSIPHAIVVLFDWDKTHTEGCCFACFMRSIPSQTREGVTGIKLHSSRKGAIIWFPVTTQRCVEFPVEFPFVYTVSSFS